MSKKWIVSLALTGLVFTAKAQFWEANQLVGEFGGMIGAAHYFGDLNTRAQLNRPKLAASLLFRKQIRKYVALRVQGSFAQVGYSDVYSDNEAQQIRNLSFNSNIFELTAQGDFNFFRFIPGEPGYSFTPYVTLGAGLFSFNPYAYLNYQGEDQKYYLRELGTEGQNSSAYPERKYYSTMAFCMPVGAGLKYNLGPRLNLNVELLYRFTNTDYLDDVSTTYAGIDAFPAGSPASLLQDRSYETSDVPIGIKGRQRGVSKSKDAYATFMVGLTFNLVRYKCPTAY